MYLDRTVAVVMPCHNEADFVRDTVLGLPDFVDEVVLVDDRSTDGTLAVMRAVQDERSGVHVIQTPRNMGVGGAMVTGYQYVIEALAYVDIVVKMDGDGQMPPERLEAIIEPIAREGYDYTKGNRFMVPELLDRMPSNRRFGNFLLTFMTKFASGYWHIFDVQNGFTAISCQMLNRLDLGRIHHGYFFENDMLVQLNTLRARVKDVSQEARYGAEVSGVNPFKVILTFPWLLIRRFWWRVRVKYAMFDFSEIALFYGLGTAFMLIGTVLSLILWVQSIRTGVPSTLGSVAIAMILLILGFQMLLQAITLDIHEGEQLK